MTAAVYTSRLQKGGALLDDMRVLVRFWRDGPDTQVAEDAIRQNVLGKASRTRVRDTLKRAFLPRFVHGKPPGGWKIVRPLEDAAAPREVVAPIYYWLTARSEPLLYEFVSGFLAEHKAHGNSRVTTDDVARFIRGRLQQTGKRWSRSVTLRVARGLLAALRDFGILVGTMKKRIAPTYLPLEVFVHVAFSLSREGASGERLLYHPDWRLFLLSPSEVEHLFLEAHRHHLLDYQAAGGIVRIEFPMRTLEEAAHAITARAP
jgi:hypothetical protein